LRVALIYGGDNKKLELFIKRFSSAAEKKGHESKIIKAERGGITQSLLPYNFVLVGCPVISLFKGKLPLGLTDYIKRCTGLERKKTIAFIIPRVMGNNKTLKNLMNLLETKGSFVIDFKEIRDLDKDSEILTSRLK
jgi:hypothetical protein